MDAPFTYAEGSKNAGGDKINLPVIGPVDKKILLIGVAILGLLVALYIIRSRASA